MTENTTAPGSLASLPTWLARWTGALGVLFFLSGVIFFFAHNWKGMSPFMRFATLEGAVFVSAIAALVVGVRSEIGRWCLIVSSVLTGVLLAVYGQVYQTGADAYEIYTLWAGLILVWAIVARFAPLWLLWFAVTQTALILFAGQVLVPDELIRWEIAFAVLGVISAAAFWLCEAKFSRDWIHTLLAFVAAFWLTLGPIFWLIDSRRSVASDAFVVFPLFLVLIGLAAWRYSRKDTFAGLPMSFAVLSLAIVTLGSGIRLLSETDPDEIGFFFLTGIMAIAVFGGAATFIVRSYRKHAKDGQSDDSFDSDEMQTPWIARFTLGLGAWIAGILLTAAIGFSSGTDAFFVVGCFALAGSLVAGRNAKNTFVGQLAVALQIMGTLLLAFAMVESYGSSEIRAALVSVAVVGLLVYWLSQSFLQRYLAISIVWVVWIIDAMEGDNGFQMFLGIGIAMLALVFSHSTANALWKPAFFASVSGLIGLIVFATDNSGIGSMESFEDFLMPSGLVIAIGFIGLLWRTHRDSLPEPVFWGMIALLIAAAIAGAPGIVLGLGMIMVGWQIGVLVFTGFLIHFYYFLGISLMAKSFWLIGIGLILLAIRALGSRRFTSATVTS